MNVSDIIVEVRDRDLVRRAQVTDADLDGLVVVARDNDVGSWELRLPDTVLDETTGEWVPHAAARELRKEGAGLVVSAVISGVPQTILSGPMTSATFEADGEDLTGRWAFSGVSDAVLLADALAFPQPTNADPTTQTAANDTRSGAAESLLRQYVAWNIAGTHAPAGRVTGLRSRLTLDGPDQARGANLTHSPRFQNLLELCQEIAFAGGLSFDIVQVGSELRFRVWRPEDRSKLIRMDMENDLLKSVTYGYGAASTTVAIVAGRGEGTERLMVSRTSTEAADSETRWGRRIERFVDQRNAEAVAELEQKGDETVKEGTVTATGLRAAPTDTETMLYLRDWNKGDLVSVVVEGQEVKSPVSEAALGVNGSVVAIVATLGEASAFDVDAASQRREVSTASRVSAIERTVEVPNGYTFERIAGTLPLDRTTGSLSLDRTTGSLSTSRVSGNLPFSRIDGTLDLSRTSGVLPQARVSGVVPIGTTAERDAYFGVPATDAERVALANQRPVWFNTDTGWEEGYYAASGLSGLTARGLVAGTEAGWYPTAMGPMLSLIPTAEFAATSNNPVRGWGAVGSGRSRRRGGASWFTYDDATGRITMVRAGVYRIFAKTTLTAGTGTAVFHLWTGAAASPDNVFDTNQTLHGSYISVLEFEHTDVHAAGSIAYVRCHVGSLTVHRRAGTANTVGGQFLVEYVGPPVVGD